MIRNNMFSVFIVAVLLVACEKEQAAPENKGTSVRLQQEALSGSYGLEASQRLLTADELSKLSPYQLKIMKNGIYARHGYTFTSRDMVEYFEKQEWYQPNPDYSDRDLTAIERENIKLLKMVETGSTAAGTAQDRRTLIKTWGARLAEGNSSELAGTEYELFDIDGDRDQDAIAFYLYTSGGNHFSCQLAIFENRDGVYVHLADCNAGERGESSLTEIVNASKGIITCKTEVWLSDDGLCCPSGTGTAVFRLTGTTLEQIGGGIPPQVLDE